MRFNPSLPLFYAVLWSALVVCIPWPREPRWEETEVVFERTDTIARHRSEEILEWMRRTTISRTYDEELARTTATTTALAGRLYQQSEAVCNSLQRFRHRNFVSADFGHALQMLDSFLDTVSAISEPQGSWRQVVSDGRLPLAYFSRECRSEVCYTSLAKEMLRGLGPAGRRVLFSALQTDVRNTAFSSIDYLYQSRMNWPYCGFEVVRVMASPTNAFFVTNQQARADLHLGVITRRITFRLSSTTGATRVEGNIGRWEGRAGVLGRHIIGGGLSCWMDTNLVVKPWSFQYRVIPRAASIQIDKSNKLYRGVPTTLSIHAQDYPQARLSLHIRGARAEKNGTTTYLIHTNRSTPSSLTAYIVLSSPEGPDTLCIQPIRVLLLPAPRAAFGFCDEPFSPSAEALKESGGLTLCPGDPDLDANLWRVDGYTLLRIRPGSEDVGVSVRGAAWTGNADALALMASLRPGDRLMAEDITATGPAERRENLPPISIRIAE